MKNLDLEKIIILLSLLLMPVAGGWIWFLKQDLKKADAALQNCGTTIKKIYALHKLIDNTKDELNTRGVGSHDFSTYFEDRLGASMGQNKYIKREEVRFNPKRPTRVLENRKQIGEDIEVAIEFGGSVRGGMLVSRSFVNAFIFNSESRTPIWKLRHLKITSEDFKKLRRSGTRTPPTGDDGMSDNWYIDTLVFARRKPMDTKS